MATMTAPYDTYVQDIQAEDVQDEVYIISPVDNPVASMSRSIRANAKNHQWSEDSLIKAQKNARAEGAAAVPQDGESVIPLNNYTQIMDKTASVTGTLEEVDKYGRDSEMAYQLELRYGELANDEEVAIMGSFDGTAGAPGTPSGTRQTAFDGAGTGIREFASLYEQIDSNLRFDASGVADIPALEDAILLAHQTAYMEGANPSYLVTSPAGSQYVSDFALSASRGRDIRNERRLINVIDLYVSNYGELDVVLDRHIRQVNTDGTFDQLMDYYLLDFNYLATPVLRATRDWPIAKLGDSDERQVLRESTYAVLNTKANAVVYAAPLGLA